MTMEEAVYKAVYEELMKLRVKLHSILNRRSDIDSIVYHAQNRACAAAVEAIRSAQPLAGEGATPPGTHGEPSFTLVLSDIQAEAGRYLDWLNSSKPLNDEFRMIKGRIVTLACQLRALKGHAGESGNAIVGATPETPQQTHAETLEQFAQLMRLSEKPNDVFAVTLGRIEAMEAGAAALRARLAGTDEPGAPA